MYILSVDQPPVSRFSNDSITPSFLLRLPSPAIPSTSIVASLFVDCSHPISSPDTWLFTCHPDWDVQPVPRLGVGDTIAVYRQACIPSSSDGPSLATPAFCGTLSHIVGWGSSTIEFAVDIISVFDTHPATIQLPFHVCRLSFLQRLWGWILPFPRCSVFGPTAPPLPPPPTPCFSEALVWAAVDV